MIEIGNFVNVLQECDGGFIVIEFKDLLNNSTLYGFHLNDDHCDTSILLTGNDTFSIIDYHDFDSNGIYDGWLGVNQIVELANEIECVGDFISTVDALVLNNLSSDEASVIYKKQISITLSEKEIREKFSIPPFVELNINWEV